MTHGNVGDAIISWLDDITEDGPDEPSFEHSTTHLGWKKRKRYQSTPPPTTSASKRRRGETATIDLDATPRPASRPPVPLTDASSSSSISQSDHGSPFPSTHPGRSTPIRQFQRMEVAVRDRVRLRQLSVEDTELPSPLKGIVRDLSLLAKSRGVIHQELQSTLLEARRTDLRLDDIDDAVFASNSLYDRLVYPNLHPYRLTSSTVAASSVCPPLHQVLDIHAAAKECHNEMHPEPSWNMLVHQQILALAAAPCWVNEGPMHFMPCTTAKIQPAYRRGSGAGSTKMIDFTMYIEPSFFGDGDSAAVDVTRKLLPDASINHTDFAPLRRRPIVLSIESKTTGHQLLEAEVQVGVWLAAQWRMLESLLTRPAPDLVVAATHPVAAVLPSFLPAVIVQAHDWHFVATTRSGECTTLWAKQTFGSSETVLGIYQIVCVLRYLAQWAEQHYWPSFRQFALGLSP